MNCLIPKDTFLDGFIREYTEKARTSAPASCFKAPAGFFYNRKSQVNNIQKKEEKDEQKNTSRIL